MKTILATPALCCVLPVTSAPAKDFALPPGDYRLTARYQFATPAKPIEQTDSLVLAQQRRRITITLADRPSFPILARYAANYFNGQLDDAPAS